MVERLSRLAGALQEARHLSRLLLRLEMMQVLKLESPGVHHISSLGTKP